ncbi:hypothetical protein QR680_006012 [Steinernema hermaphroditum]|uniref:Uncharacterized protein n=1 Tax=Steinernema hermaphroditum TaxID=289476 RepID=A0AA39HTZ1_9BILA|nr:hypothetical protein QR680_006012 [Steinernema hermaphroditum]
MTEKFDLRRNFDNLLKHGSQICQLLIPVVVSFVFTVFSVRCVLFWEENTDYEQYDGESANVAIAISAFLLVVLLLLVVFYLKPPTITVINVIFALWNPVPSGFYLMLLCRRFQIPSEIFIWLPVLVTTTALGCASLLTNTFPRIVRISISILLLSTSVLLAMYWFTPLWLWVLLLLAPIFDIWSVYRGTAKKILDVESSQDKSNAAPRERSEVENRTFVRPSQPQTTENTQELTLGAGDPFFYNLLVALVSLDSSGYAIVSCVAGLVIACPSSTTRFLEISSNAPLESSDFSAASRRMLSGLSAVPARRRLQLFKEEKARQDLERKATLKKIVVTTFNSDGDSIDLLMNKNISTGYDCAKQVSHFCAQNSALCLLRKPSSEGYATEEILGMNEHLQHDCEITFLDFVKPTLSNEVNDAYWRSCSLALGAVVQSSFRNEVVPGVSVLPDVKSGSFIFDATIKGLKKWEPTVEDLQILTKRVRSTIVEPQRKFDLLRVPVQFAEELFGNERISAEVKLDINAEGDIAVYCLGDLVDITNGPVIPNTGLIGKYEVAAVEHIGDETYRFKGVSLPRVQPSSSYTWNILVNTAAGRKSEVEESKRVAAA